MCTAINNNGFFGRTLDLEYSYREAVTIAPRGFEFAFRKAAPLTRHYAIIGMATVENGYPLFYDAVNEKGLASAGLNFPKSAAYPKAQGGAINIATFELIPYVLGKCANVDEAEALLREINVHDESFSDSFSATPLHWIFADCEKSITLEVTKNGKNIYENPVGVLANEPPFPAMMANLDTFSALSPNEPSKQSDSRGCGAVGLPGDWSSRSRFVRAAFVRGCSLPTENNGISEFLRLLSTVEVPRGCIRLRDGKNVITYYSSCMDLARGIYYYKTYNNPRICAADIHRENLNGESLISFALKTETDIFFEN